MEVIAFLQLLWRRRLLVVLGILLAIGGALAVGPSPTPSRGFAATNVLFDTAASQLVTDEADDPTSLEWRATLAGMLLGTDASRQRITGEARIPADQFAVIDAELAVPVTPASLVRAAAEGANVTPESYVLTAATDDRVPIVTLTSQAPTRDEATRLILAGVHSLQAGASSTSTKELQGLRIQQIAPVEAVQIPSGKGRKRMGVVAILLFGMWCAAIGLVPQMLAVARASRHAAPLSH